MWVLTLGLTAVKHSGWGDPVPAWSRSFKLFSITCSLRACSAQLSDASQSIEFWTNHFVMLSLPLCLLNWEKSSTHSRGGLFGDSVRQLEWSKNCTLQVSLSISYMLLFPQALPVLHPGRTIPGSLWVIDTVAPFWGWWIEQHLEIGTFCVGHLACSWGPGLQGKIAGTFRLGGC